MMLEHDGAMVSGRLHPSATDPGPDAVESVVIVRLLYKQGQGTGEVVGSGFFIDPWLQSVVTAAHVVCTPDGGTPSQIQITLFTASGPKIVEASAFAYPAVMSAVNDCAIVRLASPVVGLTSSASPAPPPKGSFPATLYGYVGDELISRNLNARLVNGLLQYDDPNASRS